MVPLAMGMGNPWKASIIESRKQIVNTKEIPLVFLLICESVITFSGSGGLGLSVTDENPKSLFPEYIRRMDCDSPSRFLAQRHSNQSHETASLCKSVGQLYPHAALFALIRLEREQDMAFLSASIHANGYAGCFPFARFSA